MMAAGFLDEVRALRAAGYGAACKPMQALGTGSSASTSTDGARWRRR